jgi:Ca-activated chloride channel family protein
MTHKIALSRLVSVAALAAIAVTAAPAFAQDDIDCAVTPDDPACDSGDANIVVTGTSVRQGGAQDIRHFRSISTEGQFMPPSSSLTLEGLLGEHDLALPNEERCTQTFCLVAHSMEANLPLRPEDKYFVGLDFASNIDADSWKGEPLSLIAVVDRSGSMEGEPIERVKEGLREVLRLMGRNDRMGIVIYGSDTMVHLPVTDVEGHRDEIRAAIDSIAIEGSTYLEAGLQLGYETAFAEQAHSRGKTRLMLFTDENPNVGDTSPEGFMGMALDGSHKGVGLTTIGVGVHFDGALAAKVASTRGGNLFFLDAAGDAGELFAKEFANMTSEVAHDITITMTPPAGFAITGVFGVPDGLMTQSTDGAVTVTVGSAFLSSNGGGIYASVGKDSARSQLPVAALPAGVPIMDVALSYVDAVGGEQGSDRLAVPQPETSAPEGLRLAMTLVDEYLTLDQALDQFHVNGDRKASFHLLDGLASRLQRASLDGLDPERELVGGLRDKMAYLAGYRGEVPGAMRPVVLFGRWEVTHFEGVDDIRRGDIVEITEDGEFITEHRSGRRAGDDTYQQYQVNERRLYIPDGDLMLRYRPTNDGLVLDSPDGEAVIRLRKVA